MIYFSHQFRLALPVFALIAGVAFVSSWATLIAMPQVGDGLDQLSAISYGTTSAVQAWVAQYAPEIICIAAIAATLLAVFQVRKIACKPKKLARFASSAAFWSGVVTVPFAYLSSPQVFGVGAVALFGVAATVHVLRHAHT
jgi:hypothetical protein